MNSITTSAHGDQILHGHNLTALGHAFASMLRGATVSTLTKQEAAVLARVLPKVDRYRSKGYTGDLVVREFRRLVLLEVGRG